MPLVVYTIPCKCIHYWETPTLRVLHGTLTSPCRPATFYFGNAAEIIIEMAYCVCYCDVYTM